MAPTPDSPQPTAGTLAPTRPAGPTVPRQRRPDRSPRSRPAFSPRRFRPDVQGLRAVAVLLVVLYHAGVPGISGGYVGVDVFFVISGYLITQQLAREVDRTGRISLLAFYGRRARRLLPASALVAVVTLLVGRLVLPYAEVVSLTRDALWTAVYGMNVHLALDGVDYQNATAPPSALQHFWSLAVEEQFYVVWPLLMIACAVLGRRRLRRPLLLAAITALVAASLFLSVTTTGSQGSLAYFGLQTRAWELGVGALLALSSGLVARLGDRTARLLGWGGLAAVLASAVVYSDATRFPGSAALLPVLGSAAVLAAGTRAVERSAETRLLGHGVLQYVGRSSYAWYLWHWPMLILLPAWWGRELALWERLEVVFLAFWFAVLTYFLENASARSLWRSVRWVLTGLGLSATVVACAGLVVALLPDLRGNGAAAQAFSLRQADLSVVRSALQRSMDTDALPSNLTPTLARAPQDYPWEKAEGCFTTMLSTKPGGCVYGDPAGTRTAVLVGDSHAEQWLNPLDQEARAAGWKLVLVAKSACPVAELPVFSPDLGREYTECRTFQERRDAAVRALSPDLVIASQADPVGLGRYTPREWADATVRAVEQMASTSARAVWIGDSAYMGDDGLACLEKNLDDVSSCVYPRTARKVWTEAYDAVGARMRARGHGFVDTVDFFCVDDRCPPVVDNLLTHRDQGHVTRAYAMWLAPMFAPIFSERTRS